MVFNSVKPMLGLGTVQFGLAYGVANRDSKPPLAVVQQILAVARQHGIKMIDTAALYGDSEAVLGQCSLENFYVVTKTPRFYGATIDTAKQQQVHDIFVKSLQQLNQPAIYGLLAHSGQDLLAQGGELLWQQMLRLKQEQQVKKIGVSVYTVEELEQLLALYPLDIVQLPLNVLDQRMLLSGMLDKLKARNIEIHVRSVFLQGLLLMDQVPDYFRPIQTLLDRWQQTVRQQHLTPLQAALIFVRNIPQVDTIVIGVTQPQQLEQAIAAMALDTPFSAKGLACNDPAFVDPSQWVLG